jgi:hypothetical protein
MVLHVNSIFIVEQVENLVSGGEHQPLVWVVGRLARLRTGYSLAGGAFLFELPPLL